jgi:hypothetical protein
MSQEEESELSDLTGDEAEEEANIPLSKGKRASYPTWRVMKLRRKPIFPCLRGRERAIRLGG